MVGKGQEMHGEFPNFDEYLPTEQSLHLWLSGSRNAPGSHIHVFKSALYVSYFPSQEMDSQVPIHVN